MPEETTTVDPQAGPPESVPQPQAGETTTPEPQAGDGQETISLDEARKLRSEAANLRKRIKAFEEADAKAKEAQMTAEQKREKQLSDYQSQNAELVRQVQELRIQSAVQGQAARLGFADPSDAARFLDPSELEFDDNGNPMNVEPLLKNVLKNKPYLSGKVVPSVPTAGGPTSPSRSVTSSIPQEITREYIASLTPEAFAKLPREVQQRIGEINYQQPWKRR